MYPCIETDQVSLCCDRTFLRSTAAEMIAASSSSVAPSRIASRRLTSFAPKRHTCPSQVTELLRVWGVDQCRLEHGPSACQFSAKHLSRLHLLLAQGAGECTNHRPSQVQYGQAQAVDLGVAVGHEAQPFAITPYNPIRQAAACTP